jgi:NAD(P)-dependent dehydrogenase (short-subunit alcohol dehydrogenase family)
MNTMSEVLRRETKNLGIEVLTVVPGRIKTFMTQEATDSDSDSEHAQIQTQTPVPKPAGAEAGAGSESESSNSRFGSLYYPNLSQILAGTSARLARDDNTSSVPTARQVAVKLCNLVERGHGRKVYPGAGGWIFQYVYPWLPLYIQDKLWEQLGQLHLVKRVVI